MVSLCIGIISFLVSGATYFGGNILTAVHVLQFWYCLWMIPYAFFAFIFLLSFTAGGAAVALSINQNSWFTFISGALMGGMVGSWAVIRSIALVVTKLVILFFLAGSINPLALGFTYFSVKEQVALLVLIGIEFYMWNRAINKKKKVTRINVDQ